MTRYLKAKFILLDKLTYAANKKYLENILSSNRVTFVKKDLTLKTDVDKNDPNDTNVQEKLKSILRTGAFSFSQKEKDALGQILNK